MQIERWETMRNAEIEEMLRRERNRGEWATHSSQWGGRSGPGGGVGAGQGMSGHGHGHGGGGKKVKVLLVGQSESGKSTVLKSTSQSLSFSLQELTVC